MRSRRRFPWLEVLIVIVGVVITISIGVPKYIRARMSLREEAAILQIQAVHRAQRQYRSRHGRFAASLTELAEAGLIGSDVASGSKQGYQFVLSGGGGDYSIRAKPVRFGSSGVRSFFSAKSGMIHENYGPEPEIPW